MREAELKCMYWDYAFEDGVDDAEKEMCMATIFRIQNEEIQTGGHYFEMPRSVVAFCCPAMERRDRVRFVLAQSQLGAPEGCWRVKCPFCGRALIVCENSIKIDVSITDFSDALNKMGRARRHLNNSM